MTDLNMGETLWAWVTQTPQGGISLVTVGLPGMGQTPLISRSEETLRKMKPWAIAHGAALGQKVWLRRYTLAEEIDQ